MRVVDDSLSLWLFLGPLASSLRPWRLCGVFVASLWRLRPWRLRPSFFVPRRGGRQRTPSSPFSCCVRGASALPCESYGGHDGRPGLEVQGARGREPRDIGLEALMLY